MKEISWQLLFLLLRDYQPVNFARTGTHGKAQLYEEWQIYLKKQMALESWERTLDSIVTGGASGKVVSIQQGSKSAQ